MVGTMSGTEVWRWGDLFEVDIPLSMTARDLDEMIELRVRDSDAPLLLAAFAPVPGPPERAAADALIRFASTRGLPARRAESGLSMSSDPHGMVGGRIAFITDLCWEAYAIAWPIAPTPADPGQQAALVLAFCAARHDDDGIFAAAEVLLSTVRPVELLVSGVEHVPADPPGDF